MFYAFNKRKSEYRYGSDKQEMTEQAIQDNIKTDINEWRVVELNEEIVTVNDKQFLRSSVPAAELIAEKAKKMRLIRNGLLAQSDWTQTNDNPLSIERKRKWGEYRQSLRDITGQSGFPESITFPPLPE